MPTRKLSRMEKLSSYVVLAERHPLRTSWNVCVALLLVYTATVLPFRLAFIDLALPDPLPAGPLNPIDAVVDALFWIDLVVNFFFTYVDATGKEVASVPLIAVRYLQTYFFINLIACLPTATFGWILGLFIQNADDKGLHKTLRIARLQRVSRLARLVRLARLAKFAEVMRENPVWNWIQSLRGVRIINLCFALLWSVHIVACGWYLCAALHADHTDTWVARRQIGSDDDMLLEAGVYTHWINAMYFVLTVFTTVGFGDMSAWTQGEILYVCFTMMLGCIINSIILSSVISILTSVDQEARQADDQRMLLDAFARHAHLDSLIASRLTRWVSTGPIQPSFDRSWLKQLLTSRAIPPDLAGDLFAKLYDGHLMRNKFMVACQSHHLPPRFPLITALLVNTQYFEPAEIVYFPHDNAWNFFMIISGIFSCFAVPGPEGGSAEVPAAMGDVFIWPSGSPTVGGTKSTAVLKNDSKLSAANKEAAEASMLLNAPYQILGHGNYFGEYELLHTATRARRTGVRCEVGGCTLALAKESLAELMSEFPSIAMSWRSASTQRESHRKRMLRRHVKKMSVRTLAVTTIQKYVRARRLPQEEQPRETGGALAAAGGATPTLRAQATSGVSGIADGDVGHLRGEVAELRGEVRQIRAMLSGIHEKLCAAKVLGI